MNDWKSQRTPQSIEITGNQYIELGFSLIDLHLHEQEYVFECRMFVIEVLLFCRTIYLKLKSSH